jgi:hypothetical protein
MASTMRAPAKQGGRKTRTKKNRAKGPVSIDQRGSVFLRSTRTAQKGKERQADNEDTHDDELQEASFVFHDHSSNSKWR